MNLYEMLKKARTEEDVKASYIKALGIEKEVTRGSVDFSTNKIWAETKFDGDSLENAFIQLLHYVKRAKDVGKDLPAVLLACDQDKAVVVLTKKIEPLLDDVSIEWLKTPSSVPTDFSEYSRTKVLNLARVHAVHFIIESDWDSFIAKTKHAISHGEVPLTHITPNNLKAVFDAWYEAIGINLYDKKHSAFPNSTEFAELFFADIMHDGSQTIIENYSAAALVTQTGVAIHYHHYLFTVSDLTKYYGFWAKYKRPPAEQHREYLLQRRDALLPADDRIKKGAFYTPLPVVEKAYQYLDSALGDNWQEEYIVWDMCCGTGNLANYHNHPRNLFASTLDQGDVDSIQANGHLRGATVFQYDYLNEDIGVNDIDYSLTDKVPQALRNAIAQGKKMLVLINPPYAEGSRNGKDANGGVANTAMSELMQDYGNASNELFTQFLARIQMELPTAVVALFSTMKYVNAPNFEDFRNTWKPEFMDGFVIHSKSFDDLKGDFPIGFCIWNQNNQKPITTIECDVYNKDVKKIGRKAFYNVKKDNLLNAWIDRPRTNHVEVVPLRNAVEPSIAEVRLRTWAKDAIGYMVCAGNDFQQAPKLTMILSSPFGNGNGFYVTKDNLWQAACTFTARRIVDHDWSMQRDQFTKPSNELPDEFKGDCLIWMLFNNSNLTASADGLRWDRRSWSITNHFIPFTEKELGANGSFESDFMVKYLKNKHLSTEAAKVLSTSRDIWRQYFNKYFSRQQELKLNRPDVGWYQVRNALDGKVEFSAFEDAYKALTAKLQPQVYEYGFLLK